MLSFMMGMNTAAAVYSIGTGNLALGSILVGTVVWAFMVATARKETT